MTKKDYIKAANIVKNRRIAIRKKPILFLGTENLNDENTATEIEEAFIELFRGDNPRFDKERFIAACKPEGE